MDILYIIIVFLVCYFIAGIIHELGHILTGLFYKWKFKLLVVGPFGIKSDDYGKINIYFEKQISYWGGISAVIPVNRQDKNIKIWAKILIGGPIISIAVGIFFFIYGINNDFSEVIMLGSMLLGMGLITGLPIPLKSGFLYTDGGRWSRIKRGGQAYAEEAALFYLVEYEIFDKCQDIKLENIQVLCESNNPDIKYLGNYHAYKYYKNKEDYIGIETAMKNMDLLKTKASKMIVSKYNVYSAK